MKKPILLIALLSSSLLAQTGSGSIELRNSFDPIATAKQFYNTPEWQKSFAGDFGVDPGVEPGMPKDTLELETLGAIRPLLEQQTEASLAQAISQLETLFTSQQAEGNTPSAMLLQITGALSMRLAEIAGTPASQKEYLRKAETYLKRSVDPNGGFPKFLRAHKNLANLYFRNDRSKEALPHFQKSIALGDMDSVSFGLLGAIYLEEGKLVSSESALRKSLLLNPGVIEFRQLLGNTLLQQERYQEAKSIFDELLSEKPNNVQFWMAQSNCYVALDQIDEAAINLEMVRAMGEANADSLMLLGDVYMNREMIDEATSAYLDAINAQPDSSSLENYIRAAETLNNFAAYNQALSVLDNVDSAYSQIDEDVQIDILTLRSEINIALGEGEAASENLKDILARDPFNGRALLTLARYFGGLEADTDDETEAARIIARNQQTAILYFERAQELEEDRVRLQAYTGEAQLRVRRDELGEAAELLEEAQAIQFSDSVQSYLDQINAVLRSRRRA